MLIAFLDENLYKMKELMKVISRIIKNKFFHDYKRGCF